MCGGGGGAFSKVSVTSGANFMPFSLDHLFIFSPYFTVPPLFAVCIIAAIF